MCVDAAFFSVRDLVAGFFFFFTSYIKKKCYLFSSIYIYIYIGTIDLHVILYEFNLSATRADAMFYALNLKLFNRHVLKMYVRVFCSCISLIYCPTIR